MPFKNIWKQRVNGFVILFFPPWDIETHLGIVPWVFKTQGSIPKCVSKASLYDIWKLWKPLKCDKKSSSDLKNL